MTSLRLNILSNIQIGLQPFFHIVNFPREVVHIMMKYNFIVSGPQNLINV